MQGIYEHIP